MTKAIYDHLPSVLSDNNDGSITYRWNIKESIDSESVGYECNEVVVWKPVSRRKITQVVIASMWDDSNEKKMINDYNASILNLLDEEASDAFIETYHRFLLERKEIKEMVANDCKDLGVCNK